MKTGIVCIAIDSVTHTLRKINMDILRLQHVVDFGDTLPEIAPLAERLSDAMKQYEMLLAYAVSKQDTCKPFDDDIEKCIVQPIRDDLKKLLELHLAESKNLSPFMALPLCSYMVQNQNFMRPKYFKRYMEVCGHDYVKTFIHITDLFVTRNHDLYDHLLRELRARRDFCDQMSSRLSAFTA
jgi:hypothetical protein